MKFPPAQFSIIFKSVNMLLHRNSKACYPKPSNGAELSNVFADFFVLKIERIRGKIARGRSANGMTKPQLMLIA